MNLTSAIYERLSGDATLVALLTTYEDLPAIFTTDPAPGDASMPYIVTAGEIAQSPFDTKTTRGRDISRDIRCYAPAGGSAQTVETIAERVRALLHRQELAVDGFEWMLSECSGPIVADEQDAYGRIVSVRLVIQEE